MEKVKAQVPKKTDAEFKKFSELKKLDKRNSHWASIDKDGRSHRITLEDFYNSVAAIKLNKAVPEKIVIQFDVAKNLSVYSCFVYRFHQPAKMQAYSTVELALKDVFYMDGEKSKSLKWMLKKSLKLGLITKNGFTNGRNTDEFLKRLPDFFSFFRNYLAHGTSALLNNSRNELVSCKDIINQLYKNKNKKRVKEFLKNRAKTSKKMQKTQSK